MMINASKLILIHIIWSLHVAAAIFDDVSKSVVCDAPDAIHAVTFNYKNNSSSIINILKVTPSCGCVSATASVTEIHPGKEGDLKVLINTEGFPEYSERKIIVETDDPAQGRETLSISVSNIEPILPYAGIAFWAASPASTVRRIRLQRNPVVSIQSLKIVGNTIAFKGHLIKAQEDAWDLYLRPERPSEKVSSHVTLVCEYNNGLSKRIRIPLHVQ